MVAKHHEVPFYVAAPLTSIDFNVTSGDNIVIEERPQIEMTHINNIRIAAPGKNTCVLYCWQKKRVIIGKILFKLPVYIIDD